MIPYNWCVASWRWCRAIDFKSKMQSTRVWSSVAVKSIKKILQRSNDANARAWVFTVGAAVSPSNIESDTKSVVTLRSLSKQNRKWDRFPSFHIRVSMGLYNMGHIYAQSTSGPVRGLSVYYRVIICSLLYYFIGSRFTGSWLMGFDGKADITVIHHSDISTLPSNPINHSSKRTSF